MTGLIGKPIDRVDGRLKVTGQATYTGDVRLPGMTHAVFVGSGIASGRIARIDTTAAERAPGVVLVLTHHNRGPLGEMPSGVDGRSLPAEPSPPLEDDQIRYYGQFVALVVAETFEQAQAAASLVDVTYRPTPPVVALHDPRAVRIVPDLVLRGEPLQTRWGNIAGQVAIYEMAKAACGKRHGDVASAVGTAEVFVDRTYTSPPEHATAMEPHAAVATWQDGALVIHTSSQWVMGDRTVLCAALQLPPEKVRVISTFIGGGFGSKSPTGWQTLLASLAAIRLGRPVKLVLTRQQVIMSIGHRTETLQRIMLGASLGGKLLAMRHHTVSHTIVAAGRPDANEYVEPTSRVTRQMYACPNYESSHELVHLNVMKPTWMRAPGEALGLWGLESAMDELAYELKLDPVELRRLNHANANPDGKPFSSKHLLACYDGGAQRFGWARRDPRPSAMRDGHTLIGWGMATASYPALILGATVRLRLAAPAGEIMATVSTAGSDIGQGAYTMLSVVAAEELGLPLDHITAELGDTSFPPCGTTGGSSLTAGTAPATKEAARALRAQLLALAARAPQGFPGADRHPDDFVFREGRISHRPSGKAITYAELLAVSGRDALEAEATTQHVFGENDQFAFQSFGAVFVEVHVDRELGFVRVARVVGVYDVGRVLSATMTKSQLVGGVVWGIGQALLEGYYYDPNKGMPVNPDFTGYLVPVNADMPGDIDVSWIGEPDYNFNSMGCRGVGEIGITGVAAAIANAVYHATGKRVRSLPITLESLL